MTTTPIPDPVDRSTVITTHVLDAALGRPAVGLVVSLTGPGVDLITQTDADGRVRFDPPVGPGTHHLTFATGPWFAVTERVTFHPEITVSFTVPDDEPHQHVALLLSPFSYTTYRGS